MGEEMRRIEESKHANEMKVAERTTNLNGEQLFVRSCNTCHPRGKEGMGPTLINMDKDFPSDDALIKFLRKGKGMMPSQPLTSINDTEMSSLVAYLRNLNSSLREDAASSKK